MTAARKRCDHVALTVFVNPAQFAPTEDLGTYPRTLQKDLDLLASLGQGVASAILVPQVDEMYPAGIELDVTKQKGTFVEVLGLSNQLEGTTRPNFFRGVSTVVSKFLNIVGYSKKRRGINTNYSYQGSTRRSVFWSKR